MWEEMLMQITDIRVRKIEKEGKLKAVASITIDNEFVVHDIKVIDGEKGFFIAMPSKKTADGEYRDIAHPINSRLLNFSFKINQPPNTEKTDSRLIINEAIVGLRLRCPKICKVYAIPQEHIPAYRIEIHAVGIVNEINQLFIESVVKPTSVISIGIEEHMPHTRNSIHESLAGSTKIEKWSTQSICIEKTKAHNKSKISGKVNVSVSVLHNK